MNQIDPELNEDLNRNEDPLSKHPEAHPLAAGLGAAGGVATGAAIGLAVGGPVAGIIGAVIGAVAGGYGGNIVGESIDPTGENVSWPGTEAYKGEAAQAVDGPAATASDLPPAGGSAAAATIEHGIRPATTSASIWESREPSHEEVAAVAWSMYEAEGKPDGQDLRHWFAAEAALRGNPDAFA